MAAAAWTAQSCVHAVQIFCCFVCHRLVPSVGCCLRAAASAEFVPNGCCRAGGKFRSYRGQGRVRSETRTTFSRRGIPIRSLRTRGLLPIRGGKLRGKSCRDGAQLTPILRTSGLGSGRGDFGYVRWATIGNLFLRYPIETWRIAPYAMLGGGAMYGNTPNNTVNAGRGRQANYRLSGQGFGHVGGGLEWRLIRNLGVFSDARYLFSGVEGLPDDQLLWRFGVRLAF